MRTAIGSVLVLALAVGCGVGTYRTARVRGEMQMRLVADNGGEPVLRWSSEETLALESPALLDASHVREAQLETFPDGSRHIVLYLTEEGAERLAEATRAYEGRRLAIVVGGRVVTAPTIRTPITEGEAHITVDGDIEAVFDALTGARTETPGDPPAATTDHATAEPEAGTEAEEPEAHPAEPDEASAP